MRSLPRGERDMPKAETFSPPSFDPVALMGQCNNGGNDGHVVHEDGRSC